MTPDAQPPRAFVSYSWDDLEHHDWVHKLATRLRSNGVDVTLDVWDTTLGSDLSLFMEAAGDAAYRVIAVVSDSYRAKADDPHGGVGYERKMITPTLMADLHGDRVIPILRNNLEGRLPRFLGAAKYVDMRDGDVFESKYIELLRDIYRVPVTPRPPLGVNPFNSLTEADADLAVRHGSGRYVSPAMRGSVTFDYSNHNGRYVIGAGNRSFTIDFGESGHGSIYLLNDPPDIKTVALAAGRSESSGIGNASAFDASSRHRTIQVGDCGIIRNQHDYWALVFVDEVLVRETSPTGDPHVSFRYQISQFPDPNFE